MGIFSFLKKEKVLRCDWCGEVMEEANYVKHEGRKKFNFCSRECKKNFRNSGQGKRVYRRCPTCAMAPKSWD